MKRTTCYKTREIWCSCGFSESKEGGGPLKGLEQRTAAPKSVQGTRGTRVVSLVSPVESYLQQESISVNCTWSLDHSLLKILLIVTRRWWVAHSSWFIDLCSLEVFKSMLIALIMVINTSTYILRLLTSQLTATPMTKNEEQLLKDDHRRQTVWLLQCYRYCHSQLDCGLELAQGASCPTCSR